MSRRLLRLAIVIAALIVPSVGAEAQPLSDDVKSRAIEMIAAWQNYKSTPNQEARIALIEKALTIADGFSTWPLKEPGRDDLLGQMWGQLGNEYLRLGSSRRPDAPERAIAAYTTALKHFAATRDQDASARAQRGLALAYLERTSGARTDNVEAAIAALTEAMKVFTRETAPDMWGSLQVTLSKALWHRISGDRADNLEQSIAAAKNALSVATREKSSSDWSAAQSALGAAYSARVHGSRADNLEVAIAAYEQALSVVSRERAPTVWAGLQDNLGMAYAARLRGQRGDNVELALAAFRRSGEVFTREASPADWAQVQMNLGNAYLDRTEGLWSENTQAAIEAYRQALTIYSIERYPERWARTQLNLGSAYSQLGADDRSDNIELAIDAYQNSLRIYTRESDPFKWAAAQDNLGSALLRRTKGQRAKNLEEAAAAYGAALRVHTLGALPSKHLKSAHGAGQVASTRSDWPTAMAHFQSAIGASTSLLAEGLNTADGESLVAETGQLFADAAFVAAEQSDFLRALNILEQGKARLLKVALGLDVLTLSRTDRDHLNKARTDILDLEGRLELATGAERLAIVQRLADLRVTIKKIIDRSSGSAADDPTHKEGVKLAHAILQRHAAIAAPIVTRFGAKLLIVTRGANTLSIKAVELPKLSSASLLNSPAVKVALNVSGWLDTWLEAYKVNWRPTSERREQRSFWLTEIEKLAPLLWDVIGGPLAEALEANRVPRNSSVLWMPQAELGMVPVGLASDPASREFLLDRYILVTGPSMASVEISQRRAVTPSKPASLAAVANPTGDLGFTVAEGAVAASFFGAGARTVLDDKSANSSNVLGSLKKSSYWHFATHGTFNWKSPRASALLLAEGDRLTIGNMLDQVGLGRPRLVVLSACETGFYDFQHVSSEFIGLPSAFLQVGAAGVIGTLWSVDDVSTALLMMRFYELHLADQVEPATALRRAQFWLRDKTHQELRDFIGTLRKARRLTVEQEAMLKAAIASGEGGERPFRHPYYWAAFQFFGA
jgi:CHAT domain-containing protein/tetratricopeptide (TPR) repeat protein